MAEYLTIAQLLAAVNAAGAPSVTYDELPSHAQAQRRHAAAILHEALLARGEANGNWDAALMLRDLHECHSCVRHVAQVYAKGIMEAAKDGLFGMRMPVTAEDAALWIARLGDASLRKLPQPYQAALPRRVTAAEAEMLLSGMPRRVLLDLRDEDISAKTPFSPEHRRLPYLRLHQNPYQAAADPDVPIFLYCRSGYLAALAAQELTQAGFRQVFAVVPKN